MPMKPAVRNNRRLKLVAAVTYRIALPVTKFLVLTHGDGYPICPSCDCTLDREYMQYCDRCGQRLSWELYEFAKVVYAPRKPKE